MMLYRKYRRLQLFIRQHLFLVMFFLSIIIVSAMFAKEIIYYLYIQTLDLRPYQNAITLWSSDFHIRYINYIEKFPNILFYFLLVLFMI